PARDGGALAAFGVRARGDATGETQAGEPGAAAVEPVAPVPVRDPAPAAAGAADSGAGRHEEPVALAAVKPESGTAQPPVLRRPPGGAPQVSINILQWSVEPARRFAFVTVDGGNMRQVREGDRIGGLTVKRIYEQMIEFGFNDSTFMLRAN
ncbi:MAG: hypothetical protein AB1689_03355, partial [Thermodesulfobacteriota bacterium]